MADQKKNSNFAAEMRKYAFLPILVCCLSCVAGLAANEVPMLELTPDKQIVHVDKLGLSGNTDVLEVLEAMPELLARGSSETGTLLPNYAIQVDGKDAGQSRDVVLMQTKLVEVDVIEISFSPSASEQNNGQGGVINIKLKPLTQDGVSGNVLLDVGTDVDVQPSLWVNYKKDKFTLRSSLMMEYYRPADQKTQLLEFDNSETSLSWQQKKLMSYKQETAKLFMDYNPTSQDKLKFRFWESLGLSKTNMDGVGFAMVEQVDSAGQPMSGFFQRIDMKEKQVQNANSLSMVADVEYEHSYRRGGRFAVSAMYSFAPEYSDNDLWSGACGVLGDSPVDTLMTAVTDHWQKPHQVSGDIKSKHALLENDNPHKLDFEVGVNSTLTLSQQRNSTAVYATRDDPQIQRDTFSTLYASPFVELTYKYQRWHLLAGARYQYFKSWGSAADMLYDNHAVTANVGLTCQVADHHRLRVIGARNITRARQKVQPYYNAELNYLFDWSNQTDWVMTNFGVRYIYADLVATTTKCDVVNVNAQLSYAHGIFSMTFAGNAYMKWQKMPDETVRGWYYNLSWQPVFMFPKQWTLSGKVLYNSKIKGWTTDYKKGEYGDCVYMQVRLSKDIRNWNVHAEFDDILNYKTYDKEWQNAVSVVTTEYNLYKRAFLVGFGYKF